MSVKPLTCPTKYLSRAITASATSFQVNNIKGWGKDSLGAFINLVAGDFGTQAWCVFRNDTGTVIEIMEFDPATIASSSITIINRGLPFDGTTTPVANYKLAWPAGTVIEFGTDNPILVQSLADSSGTVTSVSVTTANGVSGTVATSTTTPAITLTLGAITPTTVNGNTFTTGSYTLTGTAAKTLNFTNTLTLSGTDATVMTFPTTSATIARTDAANTFTGVQTMTSPVINTSIELGHVTANTLTAASGVLSIEGIVIPSISSTNTLTNKRITQRVGTVADAATVTPTADNSDMYTVTALAQAATIAAPSGTPTNGQKLLIRLLDNGTARALTWNAIYAVIGTTLPTTTVLSKYTYVGCIYNTASVKWDVVAVTTQA